VSLISVLLEIIGGANIATLGVLSEVRIVSVRVAALAELLERPSAFPALLTLLLIQVELPMQREVPQRTGGAGICSAALLAVNETEMALDASGCDHRSSA
jgi:hypothetical protein